MNYGQGWRDGTAAMVQERDMVLRLCEAISKWRGHQPPDYDTASLLASFDVTIMGPMLELWDALDPNPEGKR